MKRLKRKLRKTIPILLSLRRLSEVFKVSEKILNTLYLSIDRIYVLSGYKINRDFYRKATLYSIYSILALLLAFTVTAPFAAQKIPIFISMSISISVFLFVLLMFIAMLYMNALMLVYRRRVHFEEKLIYTLSNMIPLIATRASLAEVFSRLYYFERDPEIKHELYLILKDCALGADIITSLKRSIDRVPSPIYRDIMSSLIEGLKISQCPIDILVNKLNSLIERKRLVLRRTLTELTLLFQVYIVLGLLAPAIVIAIYAAFSFGGPQQLPVNIPGLTTLTPPIGDVFGISLLLALIWSPLLSLMFYLIFDSVLSKL